MPKCWGNNKNKGIIEKTIPIVCDPISDQQNFIIEDHFTYLQTWSIDGAQICGLPGINFSSQTILGLYTTGSCKIKHLREVSKNENEQKYHYKVTVKSCGTCNRESYSYNWVSVPKLPEGWTVTVEVENK